MESWHCSICVGSLLLAPLLASLNRPPARISSGDLRTRLLERSREAQRGTRKGFAHPLHRAAFYLTGLGA
jgi:hypothetical protein